VALGVGLFVWHLGTFQVKSEKKVEERGSFALAPSLGKIQSTFNYIFNDLMKRIEHYYD
jgi:hypothetical protein